MTVDTHDGTTRRSSSSSDDDDDDEEETTEGVLDGGEGCVINHESAAAMYRRISLSRRRHRQRILTQFQHDHGHDHDHDVVDSDTSDATRMERRSFDSAASRDGGDSGREDEVFVARRGESGDDWLDRVLSLDRETY